MAKNFKRLSDPVNADPRRRARIEQHKRAIAETLELAALRESRDATQERVAATLGVSQANVSRIEHQDDVYLSTLSGYVAALGGRLEISAIFPDGTVRLFPNGSHDDMPKTAAR